MSPSRHLPQQHAQGGDPSSQQDLRARDAAGGVFDLENPPALVDAHVLARIWGVGRKQILNRARRGEFDWLMVAHPVGPKRFSGILLARYLKGEPLYEPSFGRRRSA